MPLTILSAVYGTSTSGNNVTAVCQALVDNGNDDIPVNNDTMGPDPDPGATKFFGILYSSPSLNGGNPIALGASEGGTLDLVPVPPTANTAPITPVGPTGPVKVIHATYGSGNNGNDVTAICQNLINANTYIIPANNDSMGPDPDPGATKFFSILYSCPTINGGKPIAQACPENSTLVLDLPITVLAAVYGTTTSGNNVTSICQALVNAGTDDIAVNNTTMGPDPDPGATKSFGILYSSPYLNGGNPIALACDENTTLDLVPVP